MPVQINVALFEREVLLALEDISSSRGVLVAKKAAAKNRVVKTEPNKKQKRISKARETLLYLNAQRYVRDKKILKYLCPALKSLTGDATEVAKTITVALVPLSISGAIDIPLDPYVYAMLAFVVFKSGVEVLCKK